MSRKNFDIAEFGLILGIIIFLNIIFSAYFFRIDLTEDKRYSIASSTKETLRNLSEEIFVEVYLDGPLNPDYERLKRAIRETLDEFRVYAGNNLQYRFVNPHAIEDKKLREQYYAQLMQRGIQYKYDLIEQGGKKEEKIVFPAALISGTEKEVPVMFLKGSKILPMQQQLNQSVEGVEYELMSAIRKLGSQTEKTIAFVEGHGELSREEVSDISTQLSEYYNIERIIMEETPDLSFYKALVIAGPKTRFSERERFMLDQYIVKGGRVLFFIDALNVNRDSLYMGETFAFSYDHNLDDLLFRYGARVNADLIQDLNSGLIRVETGNGQTEMVNWPYYPILYNFGKHPIVKNLDALISSYISTIDTVKAPGIKKTPLVYTSPNTRVLSAPLQIDLNETRRSVDPSAFTRGNLPVAYLLEGAFESTYKNRNAPIPGEKVIVQDKPSMIFICSDAGLIRNDFDKKRKQPIPLGYDPELKYLFSNKEFIQNVTDFLMDEAIITVRGKEILLRPLDKVRVKEERTQWQVVNLLMPALLLLIFAAGRYYWRKRKYEKVDN